MIEMNERSKEKTSKLRSIKDALGSNQNVNIVQIQTKDRKIRSYVRFCVAPKQGIYQVTELQEFRDKLVPVEPSYREPLEMNPRTKVLSLGHLIFKEKIGEETIATEYIDPELKDYDKTDKSDLIRTIEIHVYPDESLARYCIDDDDPRREYGRISMLNMLSENEFLKYRNKKSAPDMTKELDRVKIL